MDNTSKSISGLGLKIIVGIAMILTAILLLIFWRLPSMLTSGKAGSFEGKVFEEEVKAKTSMLYLQICTLSKSHFSLSQYPSKWSEAWNKFQKQRIEKEKKIKEENKGKEVEVLTYTKKQEQEIEESKIWGYLFLYARLKFFFLLFYLPVILVSVFCAFFLGSIKRTERVKEFQRGGKLQVIGGIGIVLCCLSFIFYFALCPEISIPNVSLNINPSLVIGISTCLLAVSIYFLIGYWDITRPTTPGK